MKRLIVADDHTIINTQGIRWIEKVDREQNIFGYEAGPFLKVVYKGDTLNYKYPSVELRDIQYNQLRVVMTGQDNHDGKQ